MKLSLHLESRRAPTLVFSISTGTLISLSWAVNGGVSVSSGSIDATKFPGGMMMGVGPTRGAGFPVVSACTLLRGVTGTD